MEGDEFQNKSSLNSSGVGPGGKEVERRIEAVRERLRIETERGKEIEIGEIRPPSGEEEVPISQELKELGVETVSLLPPKEVEKEIETVILPGSLEEVERGLRRPVVEAFRWWATLIGRLVEKVGGKFRYVLKGGRRPKRVPA